MGLYCAGLKQLFKINLLERSDEKIFLGYNKTLCKKICIKKGKTKMFYKGRKKGSKKRPTV